MSPEQPGFNMVTTNWTIPFTITGTFLLFLSSHAQAFITGGRPSLVQSQNCMQGRRGGVAPLPRTAGARVTRMTSQDIEVTYDENGDINQDHVLDDYQKNPKGLAVGEAVTVTAEQLRFYHIRKYKNEGLDPHGMVGEIRQLKLESIKFPGDVWTANRPVFVQFVAPDKFRAHFEFGEVRRSTEEEISKHEEAIAAQEAATAAINAEKAKAKAEKEAEEAAANASE